MSILVALRNYLLAAATIAVLVAIPISQQLQFDQRIESFFADDNPDLKILHRSRQEFGGDEFVIVAWTEDRLFAVDTDPYPASLEDVLAVDFMPAVDDEVAARIRSLTKKLNGIPGVNAQKTQHLADLLDSARAFKPMRRVMVRQFEGMLVGDDGRTTGILLELIPEADAAISRAATLAQIRAAAASIDGEVAVAGEPVQVHDMFAMVQEDGNVLFLVSLALLSAVLFLMFRTLRWVLAPVGLVLGTVIVTRAILVLVGAELSMVSSMLNSLVTVIGIATCMHVIVHYRDLRNASVRISDSTPEAGAVTFPAIARQTMHEMAAPIFWTFVTTAIGFASLLVSQLTPVRSFSIMMCLAIAVATIGCAIILPATLGSGSRLRIPATVPLENWLDRALQMNCRAVEKQPIGTGIVCLLLFLLAIPGVLRLTVETDFSKNFKDSSTIVRSLKFVESRLGGAGSWEVSFDTPERLSDKFLDRVKELTTRLREISSDDNRLRVLSLTDLGDIPPKFALARKLIRVKREQPDMITRFYNEDARRMRIVLRSIERQSAEAKLTQIVEIRECVRDFFNETTGEDESEAGVDDFQQQTLPEASGLFVLLAEVISSLLSDQLMSFMVACSGIFFCMTIAFRSLRIGIISLFPNIFPVAVVMGTLGWMGEPVNIGTAMITSVSMGLTVDSTIHYITAFQRARRHYSTTESLQRAHASAGRALVFAHVALMIGFLVLTASRFIPLVYFGALLSVSMVGGIFGDLVLLPLLLRWAAAGSKERSEPSSPETESPENLNAPVVETHV